MNVAIINDSGIRANVRLMKKLTELFLCKASKQAKCYWGDISLVLLDDNGIQRMNRSFLKHDHPTDVISFSYDPVPGESVAVSGEILVNVEMALRLGRRFNGSERELALYIAHGCDHLTGADDASETERRRMRSRELRWIRIAEKEDLITGLLP